jgi:hypothetical protein
LSKSLHRETGLPVAPYAGLAYSTYEDRLRAIGGLNLYLTKEVSGLVIFDGVHVHPTLNFSHGRHIFSVVFVRARVPGVSYSISF